MSREDIAKIVQEHGLFHGTTALGVVMSADHLQKFAALVAAAEREACAQVAELVAREIDDTNGTATYIAAAIRARGEK